MLIILQHVIQSPLIDLVVFMCIMVIVHNVKFNLLFKWLSLPILVQHNAAYVLHKLDSICDLMYACYLQPMELVL